MPPQSDGNVLCVGAGREGVVQPGALGAERPFLLQTTPSCHRNEPQPRLQQQHRGLSRWAGAELKRGAGSPSNAARRRLGLAEAQCETSSQHFGRVRSVPGTLGMRNQYPGSSRGTCVGTEGLGALGCQVGCWGSWNRMPRTPQLVLSCCTAWLELPGCCNQLRISSKCQSPAEGDFFSWQAFLATGHKT